MSDDGDEHVRSGKDKSPAYSLLNKKGMSVFVEHVLDGCRALSRHSSRVPSDYPLICKPFSEERAHETRRRVTPSHVSVFLLGYPPESAPDRQKGILDYKITEPPQNGLQ